MARPENTDYMQNFRFHVIALDNASLLQFSLDEDLPGGEAGFSQVTIPDVSVDAPEYREGTMTWTRKQPGIPTVGECTLSRGIVRRDTSMLDWVLKTINGGSYRTDLLIMHYHRDEPRTVGTGISLTATRKYLLRECFPTMAKPAGDLDATSGDISIAEMTINVEEVEIDLRT